MAGECVLIKQSELDEIKKNHPDAKLLEKINKLEMELTINGRALYIAECEIIKLKESPIVKIDPMKMEIAFLEVDVSRDSWGSYPHRKALSSSYVTPVNFRLDKNLKRQVSSILDILSRDLIKKYNTYRNEHTLSLIEKVYKDVANMGYWERKKLIKQYKSK